MAVFAPMTLVITVALTALSGEGWAWPWVLGISGALLGGGAGLLVFVAVTQLVPGPDPTRRSSILEHGDTTGQGIFMIFAGLVPAAPAVAVALAGSAADSDLLRWAAVPAGLGTGSLVALWLGRGASRRLEARGPELLQLMRTGKVTPSPNEDAPSGIDSWPGRTRALLFMSIWVGSILLFPQGLVPLAMKLTGSDDRVWFLPLYLPEMWQWPAIGVMVALGLLVYGIAFRAYRRAKARSASATADSPVHPAAPRDARRLQGSAPGRR